MQIVKMPTKNFLPKASNSQNFFEMKPYSLVLMITLTFDRFTNTMDFLHITHFNVKNTICYRH